MFRYLIIILILIFSCGISMAGEIINNEGKYSFNLPDGWETVTKENSLIAFPKEGKGYKFRIIYKDFPEGASLNNIPRLFSDSCNFTLKESGELTGNLLKSMGAKSGIFLKGHFMSPHGEIEVEEVYVISGIRGYGIYIIGYKETSLLSHFKIDPSVAVIPVKNNTPDPNQENKTQGPEVITPDDGVDMATLDRGAKVEGARQDKGNINAMIDGESSDYTSYSGFTYALLNEPITITLDKVYLLNRIDILFWDLNRSYYQYIIEVSVDKEKWDVLADRNFGEWYGWQYIGFQKKPIKYIRINCSYNSDNLGDYKIVEVVAYLIKK